MLALPPQMEAHRAAFEATIKTFVKISVLPDVLPSPTQSRIGGTPYWKKGEAFPLDSEGTPLAFLAQINFAEVPAFENFPTDGILQFFIGTDDLYGMDFDDRFGASDFKAIYHPVPHATDNLETVFPTLSEAQLTPLNVSVVAITFELAQELVPQSDYRFDKTFGEDFFEKQFKANEWDVAEAYGELHDSIGHKMGGYAFFTQWDIRDEKPEFAACDTLLLQIDTDNAAGTQWGDMGVANFFIRPEDLAARDFSRVLYNWDCY